MERDREIKWFWNAYLLDDAVLLINSSMDTYVIHDLNEVPSHIFSDLPVDVITDLF